MKGNSLAPNLAIRAENLGKSYRLGEMLNLTKTLKETISSFVKGKKPTEADNSGERANEDILWALRGASFELSPGEKLGIIGPNGAGKSTLLKLLCRITPPSEGFAEIYGRVASLLEVGTGFHPELTGRENIFLNGSILGMKRKEIMRKFDEIVAFSGVERFLETPIKRYSSGMRVRLGFSVAAHLDPEILIVDEVLAVGDSDFRKKCLGKMNDVSREGRTVLFVSHNMQAINTLCDRCLLLDHGRVIMDGPTEEVVKTYASSGDENATKSSIRYEKDSPNPHWIQSVSLRLENGRVADRPIDTKENVSLVIEFGHRQPPERPLYGAFYISDALHQPIFFSDSRDHADSWQPGSEEREVDSFCIQWRDLALAPGLYHVTVGLNEEVGGQMDLKEKALSFEIVDLHGHRQDRPGYFYRELPWQDWKEKENGES